VALEKNESEYSIIEAQWIREGQPIIFEGKKWYPQDIIENLLDDEMLKIYTYKKEPVYIEKKEVRPYDRLYTKFGKNKYRLFEKND
jgi:hypothetical protein